jgi:hypothetical protein
MNLDELLNRYKKADPKKQEEIIREAKKLTDNLLWVPNPGPQTEAYFSKADVMLYGGAAAGGKSELGLGLAITQHQRSLIMRRKYTDLSFLTDRAIAIVGSRKGFNGSAPPKFNLPDGRLIEFGAANDVGSELDWMGRPHDLLYVDESTHFTGSQIRALMGWVRSTDPTQRVRVVLGSNPPLSDEGLWVFNMFAPWLDPEYPNPAEDGELRWCCVGDNDLDIWVDGPGDHLIDGRMVRALSRTFIRARLADNPFQNTAEYRAQLDGLPMYMRDAIRDGNFLSVRKDHRFQLIPSMWIKMAMDKWTPQPPENIPMCVVAADMTGITDEMSDAKPDKFTIASRHDGYYNEIEVFNAAEKNSGAEKAAAILKHRRDGAQIVLDMGGGYGDATYEHLTNNGEHVLKYKGAESSTKRTKKSKIPYANKRADVYFSFMEDLDPDQPGGSRIVLPPNKLLMADLCSIRFDASNEDSKLIKLESKKDLRKRHGRSTDYSDPVVMAWSVGDKQDSHYHVWKKGGRTPRVIMRKPR